MLKDQLSQIARRVLTLMNINSSVPDIYLVTEQEMLNLNSTWRNKNKSTNVLAFPHPKNFPSPLGSKKLLGEIYLCESYIKKHNEDIRFMLIHGLLHLLGFNHIKKSDRIQMEKLEKKLLNEI